MPYLSQSRNSHQVAPWKLERLAAMGKAFAQQEAEQHERGRVIQALQSDELGDVQLDIKVV
jgi:hypothetical protein